jgi:hypothetical protein
VGEIEIWIENERKIATTYTKSLSPARLTSYHQFVGGYHLIQHRGDRGCRSGFDGTSSRLTHQAMTFNATFSYLVSASDRDGLHR